MTEGAFRSLYGEYRDPLFRFGYRLTGSAEAAEDLVHDCFVGLFRGGFDDARGSMKTYLYSSLRNLCRKRYRDFGWAESADDIEESAVPGDALNELISRETAVSVQSAVAALPLVQREALVLFEYEELTLDEISRIVGVDVGAVKSRLYRARESLRKSLKPSVKNRAMKEATR